MIDPTVVILSVLAVVLIGFIVVGCYFLWDAHQAARAFSQANAKVWIHAPEKQQPLPVYVPEPDPTIHPWWKELQ